MQVKLARDAQEDIFQRRASEVDSEPQGKEPQQLQVYFWLELTWSGTHLESSRVATRLSWSPLSGLKGVQPPLPFGAAHQAPPSLGFSRQEHWSG